MGVAGFVALRVADRRETCQRREHFGYSSIPRSAAAI
jgi:hypothetical protein